MGGQLLVVVVYQLIRLLLIGEVFDDFIHVILLVLLRQVGFGFYFRKAAELCLDIQLQ